jgi:hypothetical protein
MDDSGCVFFIVVVILFTALGFGTCYHNKASETTEHNRKILCHQASGMYLEEKCWKKSDSISLTIPSYVP